MVVVWVLVVVVTVVLVAATKAIIDDPDQSQSDHAWFRQSWDEIQRQRDGITVDASRLPRVHAKLLPGQSRDATDSAWLTVARERRMRTAATNGIVPVRDATDDAQQRPRSGRLLERVELRATGHGFALQQMDQLTERPDRELEVGIAPRGATGLGGAGVIGWPGLHRVPHDIAEARR